jgi:transketolase C-terminal domain/subunit
MTYREEITAANLSLAEDPMRRFVGYGLKRGRAYGTLAGVAEEQIVDTIIAENLMLGMAIGISLKGYQPLVFFERMDFMANACDAIVNHLDKIATISRGAFMPAVIIRAVVGNTQKPLYTGSPHTQNLTEAFLHMTKVLAICDLHVPRTDIRQTYWRAAQQQKKGISTLIVEHKDLL